jgi:hypothetical protein
VKLRRSIIALALAAAIAVSACSGSATETTTTTEALPTDLPALEFGNGVLPVTVPSNFPMPQPSTIATTMIDGSRELTEVVFNVGGNIDDVRAFYATNLPRLGYEVSEEREGNGDTKIALVGHGIDGVITLKVVAQNITSGILVFVYA